ncbi:MAG: outer rane autotransporter barrel domain protein [Solirubrobacterales bacterium]|nr:outer rane autotransporter barrel domain protein [Solirubrobacterales bacterium]
MKKVWGFVGLAAVALAVALPSSASASGIIVTPDSLPNAEQGKGYFQDLGWQADGVTVSPPVTFAITSGSLPQGFSLNPVGNISGMTQALGPSQFDVTATDTAGHSGTRSYTLWVGPDTSLVALALFLVNGAVKCGPQYVQQILGNSFPRPCYPG